MKLTRISIDGVKGRQIDIPVQSPCLLLSGPMGSGKSTVIEGLHLALNLPTKFGKTGLDALSPTGNWTVTLEFGGGEIKRLVRVHKGGRAHYEVNGIREDAAAYQKALDMLWGGSGFAPEPHHVALDEFLNLSGQKRAALFAAMLEESTAQTIDAMLPGGAGKTTLERLFIETLGSEHAPGQWGGATELLGRLQSISASPSRLADAVRAIANERSTYERDCKTRLEGLQRQQMASAAGGGASGGATPEELKRQIQAIDEKLGGLREQHKSIELDRQRYDAAQKLVQRAEKAETDTKATLESAKQALAKLYGGGEVDGLQEVLDAHVVMRDAAKAALDQATAAKAKAKEEAEALTKQCGDCERSRKLLADLLAQKWMVPLDWLDAEYEQLLVDLKLPGKHPPGLREGDPDIDRILRFAREIVAEVLGGDLEKVDAHIAKLREQMYEADGALEMAENAEEDATTAASEASSKVDLAATHVTYATDLRKEIATLTEKVGGQETDRIELAQKAQAIVVSADAQILTGQIEAAEAERAHFSGQLRALEANKALSGQVEDQRLETVRAGMLVGLMKHLADVVQRWRDDQIRVKLQAVIAPFEQAFATVWGGPPDGAKLVHSSKGEGRSTEFSFALRRPSGRGGGEVDFGMLSDGESVLTAAAFLTALQKLKGGGTLLTLNTEALDLDGLCRMLRQAPRLGLDQVVLANNRAEQAVEVGGAAWPEMMTPWQVVRLGPPIRS